MAIVRTIGRMAWRGNSIETELRQLGDPTSDIYELCFEKSIALIRGNDAHRLFMALSLFATDAGRDALGYVASFEENILSRDEGLSDLEILSLVNKDGNRFSLEPMTKVQAQAELTADPAFEQAARERWIDWHKALASRAENPTNYTALRSETDNILEAMGWLVEQDRMTDVGWFFRRTQKYLYAQGHWEPLLQFAERIARWAEMVGDPEMFAATLQHPISILRKQGVFSRGEEWLEQALIAAVRLNDELLQAEVWLAQGRFLCEQGAFSRGVQITSKSLDVFRRHAKHEKMIQALNTLGNLYLQERRFEKASHFYREGLHILEAAAHEIPGDPSWHAILQGNLSLVIGRQGDYAEACDILYEIIDELVYRTDVAEVYAALAFYELQLGHTEQAQALRNKADRIIDRLDLTRPLCEEDDKWRQLHGQTA